MENLKKNRAGKTRETSDGDTGTVKAGLYRHPEAKTPDGKPVEMITLYDPLFGDAQSNAALRLGFERVGDAPEGSIKTIVEQNMNSRIYNADTVQSDKARLDALELAELRREKAEREAAEEAKATEAVKETPKSEDVEAKTAPELKEQTKEKEQGK